MYDGNEDKQVNTDTQDNVYYNYEEPVKAEKKGLFKKIFKGKKKVTTSDELGVQENFYGDDYQKQEAVEKNNNQTPKKEENNYNKQNKKQYTEYKKDDYIPPKNNNSYKEASNNTNNDNNDTNESYGINYNYKEPEPEPEFEEPAISKKSAYTVLAILLMVGVIVIVINLLSAASEKYVIEVGYSSIALKSGESYQLPFLTNDVKHTKFKVADNTIASVNSNGYITAKSIKSGEYIKTELTVGSDSDKKYKKVTIYVVPTSANVNLESFEVESELTVKKGERKLIEITNITPPNNTQTSKYRYESADSGIATVDSGGYIYGVKKGTTTITVRNSSNPELNKIINITIK